MADIVLINPRFEVSYWGFEHALPLLGKQAHMPVACLPLLAALTPPGHTVTLIDENVEPIDFERCARADIVGVTGMIVQRFRSTEILAQLKRMGCFTVVGGPWVSVKEDYFGTLADVVFVGEAEETWPRFLGEWRDGLHLARYEQHTKTDMTTVPVPRFDLLRMDRYFNSSVQFSRGCPFQCEFCDIIVTFGRRPRIKTSAQVIAELEALVAAGKRTCFIVDDNLIGNKQAIKPVLRDVIAWQESRNYPLTLSTEASIDLAEDTELIELMADANIISVFIGVETPNEASLNETKKYQNVRAGGTIVEKVRRIQDAGIEVWCGLIVGFDNDDATIFEAQRRFLRESNIASAMLGMLTAIPKTPLHERLAAEGRLDLSDAPAFGTNVIPRKIGRAELRDGYVRLLNDLYEPEAYFERLEGFFLRKDLELSRAANVHLRRTPWRRVRIKAQCVTLALLFFLRLMRGVPEPSLRREYRRRIVRFLKVRRDPAVLLKYLLKCAMHYHALTMARQMMIGKTGVYNSF